MIQLFPLEFLLILLKKLDWYNKILEGIAGK
jgi:hypothetical protein